MMDGICLMLIYLLLIASSGHSIVIHSNDPLTTAYPNRFSTICVVTANMLYANGYFVRELTPDEVVELAEYDAAMVDYNKQLQEHLSGTFTKSKSKWIFGGRFIFPGFSQSMPRRPSAPSFCTAPDTVIHQLNGCIVQNYRLYIGSLYVRQLNAEEKALLDEYDIKLKDYQQSVVENMRRQLGTMVGGVWYPYDRVFPFHRQMPMPMPTPFNGFDDENRSSSATPVIPPSSVIAAAGPPSSVAEPVAAAVAAAATELMSSSTTSPLTVATTTASLTDSPPTMMVRSKVPQPPKLCTQIF